MTYNIESAESVYYSMWTVSFTLTFHWGTHAVITKYPNTIQIKIGQNTACPCNNFATASSAVETKRSIFLYNALYDTFFVCFFFPPANWSHFLLFSLKGRMVCVTSEKTVSISKPENKGFN